MEKQKILIIPAAGKSTRFPGMRPKWLLTHPDGKLMIQKAIEGIFNKNDFDKIIITWVKEHAEKYDLHNFFKQVSEQNKDFKNLSYIQLSNFTSSPAETVYLTLKELQKNEKEDFIFTVKDSDNHVSIYTNKYDNNFVGVWDLNINEQEISKIANKSFVITNENNSIIDIVEKKIKSHLISVGVYGFNSADYFIKTYESMRDIWFDEEEMYLSHVIAYMISKKENFEAIEANEYEDWGTLEDWEKIRKKHCTYFVDIDGVIMKNSGRYGKINWYNNKKLIKENVLILEKLYDEGATIIFTTSRDKKGIQQFEKVLEKSSLSKCNIIGDLQHSKRYIINDFAKSNSYPSCEAINISRNGLIEDYL